MLDIFSGIESWVNSQKRFSIASVIYTWGSAPRKVGSAMAISEDMDVLGSVSGGCVEGVVIREALDILSTGDARKLTFGITNEEAWEVGFKLWRKAWPVR